MNFLKSYYGQGACVRHLPDSEKFLAGHHITISVRNEDELDIEQVLEKVSKCTVSQFNFKEKPQGIQKNCHIIQKA